VITIVLDDDPTGTQAMSDVSVVLDWSERDVWRAVRLGDRAVHVLTNSRAHAAEEAGRLVASAAEAARSEFPGARVVLRGDSTLRAHLWAEYETLRAVVVPGRAAVPLLLVPALPAAGRVTIGGVHLLERDGERVPLDRTEYACDGDLSYGTADLARWAEERSGGQLAATDAIALPLARLRGPHGAESVAAALAAATALGRPAAVIPDAETDDDLLVIADGLCAAEAAGVAVIVRCSPAFVVALTGSSARTPAAAPSGDRGVLVVCGSFVAGSTAQLEQLARRYPAAGVTAHVGALAGSAALEEIERITVDARASIERAGLAVVATERERDPALVEASSQRRIASALAEVARRVEAGVVIAKGGITSAVTAREGLGARAARVIGPIVTGVALWRLPAGVDYVVVPGNVGGPDLLADVVAAIAPRAPAPPQLRC
jgi:Sugar-binding N-terminal domain/Nucleotide-binding C-terminal domain